jgi:hypothetical protein
MIDHPFVDWLVNSMGSAAAIGIFVFIFSDALLARFFKSVDHKFARELEETKAEIRANERKLEAKLTAKERELEKIQDFVGSLRRERSAAVAAKRMQASELALRRCNHVARLTMAVETLKILKIDNVLARLDGDLKLQSFFGIIVESMKVDDVLRELSTQDPVLPSLYLSERAKSYIDV